MEREGYVSLWVGNTISDMELSKYLEIGFTDDGDYIPSQFLIDFNIDVNEFEEDYLERNFVETPTGSIMELIKGCSYEESILERLKEFCYDINEDNLNSAFLLYNFQFDENVEYFKTDKYYFRYICSVKYVN